MRGGGALGGEGVSFDWGERSEPGRKPSYLFIVHFLFRSLGEYRKLQSGYSSLVFTHGRSSFRQFVYRGNAYFCSLVVTSYFGSCIIATFTGGEPRPFSNLLRVRSCILLGRVATFNEPTSSTDGRSYHGSSGLGSGLVFSSRINPFRRRMGRGKGYH